MLRDNFFNDLIIIYLAISGLIISICLIMGWIDNSLWQYLYATVLVIPFVVLAKFINCSIPVYIRKLAKNKTKRIKATVILSIVNTLNNFIYIIPLVIGFIVNQYCQNIFSFYMLSGFLLASITFTSIYSVVWVKKNTKD